VFNIGISVNVFSIIGCSNINDLGFGDDTVLSK
jgi:hypothetical protein